MLAVNTLTIAPIKTEVWIPIWFQTHGLFMKFLSNYLKKVELKLQINNLFGSWYETNGWVYQYVYENQEYTMDGYFPQAPINAMFGLSVSF